MGKTDIKLGFQAPKNYRYKHFNNISIEGDYAYCESHNFIYNSEEQERKLYNAEPCFYTDSRYCDGDGNFFKRTYLAQTQKGSIGFSLKACFRIVENIRNIPLGTIIDFTQNWYIPNKKIDFGYRYKVKKENVFDPKYEINGKSFTDNFTNCEKSKKLVEDLRKNGFIVSVSSNSSFLLGMVNNACKLTGQAGVDSSIDGEIATAWGYGKKIGFSSFDNDYRGYSNGCDNILWDKFGEFDKWSRCNEIDKKTPNEEIIKILINNNKKYYI